MLAQTLSLKSYPGIEKFLKLFKEDLKVKDELQKKLKSPFELLSDDFGTQLMNIVKSR